MTLSSKIIIPLGLVFIGSFALAENTDEGAFLHNPGARGVGVNNSQNQSNQNNLRNRLQQLDFSKSPSVSELAIAAGFDEIGAQTAALGAKQVSGITSSKGGRGAERDGVNEAGNKVREQISEGATKSIEGIQESTEQFTSDTLPNLTIDEGPIQEAIGAVAQASQAAVSGNPGAGVGAAIVDSIVAGLQQLAETRVALVRTIAAQFTPPPGSSGQNNVARRETDRASRLQSAGQGNGGPGPILGANASAPTLSNVPSGFGFRNSGSKAFRGVNQSTVYNYPEGISLPDSQ